MSKEDKLLPDLDTSVKTKRMQNTSTDIPVELPIEDDEETDSESESETDSSDTDSEYECKVCDKKFSGYKPLKQHQKGKSHAKMVLRKKKERKLMKDGFENEGDGNDLIPEPYATCETCDKQFSGPEAYQLHLKSKKHKQKVSIASIMSQFREKGEIDTEKLTEFYRNKQASDDVLQNAEEEKPSLLKSEDKKSSDEFECKECCKGFSGLIPFTVHLTSKVHAKQLEKMKMLQKVIPGPSENATLDEESSLSSLCVEDDILVCKLCKMSFSGPENAMMHLRSKNHSKTLDRYVRKLKKKGENEAKDLESSSGRKGLKAKPENDPEEKTPNEEEPITEHSSKSDIPDNPAGVDEAANSATSSDNNVKKEIDTYERYKKYKEVMHSLQGDDKILN